MLLIDTSVAVDLINEVEAITARVRSAEILHLSVVSQVELEAGPVRSGVLDPLLRARLDALLERVEILPFT